MDAPLKYVRLSMVKTYPVVEFVDISYYLTVTSLVSSRFVMETTQLLLLSCDIANSND
jgi:hypothetical protein